MSHVSKSQRAKIFDLWVVCGVADALADGVAFCSAFCLLDEVAALGVAEFVEGESAEVADALADVVAFCSAFSLLAEVAALGVADALAEVAALAALVELPQVSLNSLSDCSSRSNSSWRGTPCGA